MMIKILDQIKMAVATSSSSHSFKLKTENHSGLFSLFDKMVKKKHLRQFLFNNINDISNISLHQVLGDDPRVGKAKPAPDIFLVRIIFSFQTDHDYQKGGRC